MKTWLKALCGVAVVVCLATQPMIASASSKMTHGHSRSKMTHGHARSKMVHSQSHQSSFGSSTAKKKSGK